MPKPWSAVASSPEYQALSPDQQDAARSQYFDQVVAPQVQPNQLSAARQQFDAQTGRKAAQPTAKSAEHKGMLQRIEEGAQFVGGNLGKGVADVAGLPVDLANSAIEGAKGGANALGAHLKAVEAPVGGSDWIKQKLTQAGVIPQAATPTSAGGRILAAGLEGAPSAVLPGGASRILPRIGAAFGGGAGGEAGRQIGGMPGQLLGSLLGGGVGGMAGAGRAGVAPRPLTEAARASRASGIPLTIGQESGNTALKFTENRLRELFPSAGTAEADEARQVRAGVARVNQLADQMSAPSGVPNELLQTNIGEKLRTAFVNTVGKIAKVRDDQAARDYGEVRKLAGNAPVVKYDSTMQTLDRIIAENQNVPTGDAKKILSQAQQMKRELTQTAPGSAPSAIVNARGQPIAAGTAPTQDVVSHTINDAMKTRSAWGKAARRSGNLFTDIDPNANQVYAKRLFAAINRDFEQAGSGQGEIADALKKANANYAKSSQSLQFVESSALGKLLGKDVADAAFSGVQGSTQAPEAIAKRYLSLTPSQAKAVTAILQVHSPETLQDAKAFVLRNALNEATNTAPGTVEMSFARFQTQMRKVSPILSKLGFTQKEINDIRDVTDTMARAGDRTGANPSRTSAAGHMLATGGLLMASPAAGAASIVAPYIAAKALLTPTGRALLKRAYGVGSGTARAAAIGALRAQYGQVGQQQGQQQ
jgi:hypothetical protein